MKGKTIDMKHNILQKCDPIVTALPGYANTLSIALLHKAGQQWFLQKYLNNLHFYDIDNNVLVTEYLTVDRIKFPAIFHTQPENILCPAIDVFSLPKYALSDNSMDIIECIKYFINRSGYLRFNVDRKYILEHKQNISFTHDIFVYGYNDDKSVIYISDYFKGSAYKNSTCSYREILDGFLFADLGIQYSRGGFYDSWTSEKVNILHYKEDFEYIFRTDVFCNDLKYYLNYQKYNLNYEPLIMEIRPGKYDVAIGNKQFDFLSRYIEQAIKKEEYIDITQLCHLVDHKRILAYKVQYLSDIGIIKDDILKAKFEDLVIDSITLRNRMLKYNFSLKKDDFLIESIKKNLSNMKIVEEMALLSVIDYIQKSYL